jgi:hypothetical protein
MSGDVHKFDNIETRAVFSCFPARQGANEVFAILPETLGEHAHSYAALKTGWPRLNVVIFRL